MRRRQPLRLWWLQLAGWLFLQHSNDIIWYASSSKCSDVTSTHWIARLEQPKTNYSTNIDTPFPQMQRALVCLSSSIWLRQIFRDVFSSGSELYSCNLMFELRISNQHWRYHRRAGEDCSIFYLRLLISSSAIATLELLYWEIRVDWESV